MKNLSLAIVVVCTFQFAHGQTAALDFTLTNSIDSTTISLSQFSSSKGVVVVFTSNVCPFDNYYKDRLKEMISAYKSTVQFLLINSNLEPEESIEKMAIRYADMNTPYLADKDQVAMTLFGAHKTPEVFLISNAGGKPTVVYSGAIDDNPQAAKNVSQRFLKDALDNMLAGQKIEVANNRAAGCTIRKK